MFLNFSKSIKSILSLVVLFGTAASLAQSADAQSISTSQSNISATYAAAQAARPVKKFNGSQNAMYETQVLKSSVSLQHLPEYSGRNGGAKFDSGISYPRLRTGQCVLLRFLCKDSTTDAMAYYRNSLLQNGWQIADLQTNAKQLTATRKKDGLYCTFCVFSSYKPGFRTSFEIKYLYTGATAVR